MLSKRLRFFTILILAVLFQCCKSENQITEVQPNPNLINKPTGLYSSSFGNISALDNEAVQGALIRVTWESIEAQNNQFNFSVIDDLLIPIREKNLNWSLAIIAGGNSPTWLYEDLGVTQYRFVTTRADSITVPKIWDPILNEQLLELANALAEIYNKDEKLKLIYIPQMTANGIEGHFNGVSNELLIDAGLTEDRWVKSVKTTAKHFATAFKNKAIAVEVHNILGSAVIPSRIINELWNDPDLDQRVGAAMWWLSGRSDYQNDLIEVLTAFEGDIYAQAIGRSDQSSRFLNNDYSTIFDQAQQIGIQYIELWEYEFINNTYIEEFRAFNEGVNSN